MKLTIKQTTLANLIARGGVAAQKKAPIPALEHFRLIAGDDTLSLASSDMDRFAEATGDADVSEPGSVLVPAEAFKTLIGKHAKGADILIVLDGDALTVKAGRSNVRLPTLSVENFPTWADEEPISSFALSGKDFDKMLSRVRFAASDSEAHINLQGVCIDASDGDTLYFVATDTHRLARSGIEMPEGAEKCPRAIVPNESVDAALAVFKGAGKVDIAVTNKAASFSADGLRLSGRLIALKFPDYERFIPARGEHPTASFERAAFVDCLERANVMTGDVGVTAAITFEPVEGGINLRARNHKGGAAEEGLDGEVSDGFVPFKFNPRLAASFLSTLNVANLTIEQSNPAGAHLIFSQDAPDFLGLLMPVNK